MPLFRYYLSASPGDVAPATDFLDCIEGECHADVAERLRRQGRLPANSSSLWIHFLVWAHEDGCQRGFESLPLAKLLNGAAH